MAQIIDPVPQNEGNSIVCCYVNATSQIQVARITNIPNWYFERVIFPGQRLVFEALQEGLLEIHTGMMASAILSDTIPCYRLCVNDNSSIDVGIPSMAAHEMLPKNSGIDAVDKSSFSNKTILQTAINC
jgi:Domain of unknown function (DUF1830)